MFSVKGLFFRYFESQKNVSFYFSSRYYKTLPKLINFMEKKGAVIGKESESFTSIVITNLISELSLYNSEVLK